jgi:hypothetical protein
MAYQDPFVDQQMIATITRHASLLGDRQLMPDQYLKNDKTKQLGVRIASGNRQGLEITKDEYVVDCAAGTVFTKPVVVDGSAIIKGAVFTGRGDAALVTVSGNLLLVNCILTKEGTSAGSYISVGAAGKLQLNGCMFTGTPGGGNVVITAGGAATAIGNLNTTGRSHGAGVTVVGEVT